jgi:hypothetical protein
MSSQPVCRLRNAGLSRTFVDLGMSPLRESYVEQGCLDEPEIFYPLHVRLRESCLLVPLSEPPRGGRARLSGAEDADFCGRVRVGLRARVFCMSGVGRLSRGATTGWET